MKRGSPVEKLEKEKRTINHVKENKENESKKSLFCTFFNIKMKRITTRMNLYLLASYELLSFLVLFLFFKTRNSSA